MSDLAELGLSSYEATVYRTLLALGAAPAREISAASEVPRGRIYDVLNTLDSRELVRTYDTRDPTQYGAVDPDVAVDRLLDERKRELSQQRQHYEDVAETVQERLSTAVPTESRFWTAGLGSDEACSLASDQQELAETRITSVIGSPYENARWEQYAAEIEVIEREIDPSLDVRVLVSETLLEQVDPEIQDEMFDLADNLAVRATSNLTLTVDVIDGHVVYVHVTDPLDPTERLGVVAVRDETFASHVESAFEDVWQDARPVTGR
jgi:sugar-specific transcriptional regulator TrmB